MNLQSSPDLYSVDSISAATQEAAQSSLGLMRHVFKPEDVSGTPAEALHKMTQKVVATQAEELDQQDRLKLYGLIIARALANQDGTEINHADFPFLVNLGSPDQRNDCDPSTIWIRNPQLEKSDNKGDDCSRKALLSVEALLSMLEGNGIQQSKTNPRRWTQTAELDDFFAQTSLLKPKRKRNKKPSPKIRKKDLFASIADDTEAQSTLEELYEIFPAKLVRSLRHYHWAVRFHTDGLEQEFENRDQEKDAVICKRVAILLTALRRAARSSNSETEKIKIEKSIELIEKLRTFVQENASDKIIRG